MKRRCVLAKCRLCNYEWTPRVQEPRACPACKRRDWREPMPRLGEPYQCHSCGYEWRARNDNRPGLCPACKSTTYDLPDPAGVWIEEKGLAVWIPDRSVERDCCERAFPTSAQPDRLLKHCRGAVHRRHQQEEPAQPGTLPTTIGWHLSRHALIDG